MNKKALTGVVLLGGLLIAALAWSDIPKNIGNLEAPTSTRCVNASGAAFESCSGSDFTRAGEDIVNDVMKTEQRFAYSGNKTADTAVKAAPGFVHQMVCIGTDAAATAGTIILYDNTAESGTVIFSWAVQAAAYAQPVVIPLDVTFAVGLYLGFTTTADVTCTVSYR